MLASSSRLVWRRARGTKAQSAIATYVTAASFSRDDTQKHPQVERAIRIKSQQRKRHEIQAKYEQTSRDSRQEQPISEKYSPFQKRTIIQRQPLQDLHLREQNDYRSGRYLSQDTRLYEKEDKFESQLRAEFNRGIDKIRPTRRSHNDASDRFVRSEGTPRASHNFKGRENLRQLRVRICLELSDLARSVVKAPAFRKEAAFAKAESLFEPLSGIERRESRLYTAMIRLALYAKKRKKASALFTEMKKNGVAPDIFVYRAILEGSLTNFPSPSEETDVHQQLEKIFEGMMQDWELATSKASQGFEKEGRLEDEDKEQTGTARSYTLTKQAALKTFLDTPALFATSCSHYLRYLIFRREIDEAAMLVRRGKDLAATNQGKSLLPQLPFILSSRFFREVMQGDFELNQELKDNLVMMFKVMSDTLINQELRARAAKQLGWLASERYDNDEAKEKERFDIDVAMSYALRAMAKYEIQEGKTLVCETLQQLYNDEYFALHPVLSTEVSMRYGMQICNASDPELALKIFDEGLKFYSQVHRGQTRPSYKAQDAPDNRDITALWTSALDIAIMKCNDLNRGVSVLEQARDLKKKSIRLSPSKLPMGYIMSHFMRKIAEQEDWMTGIKVWQLWTDDDVKNRRSNESFYLRFLTHFLMLAYRAEKKLVEMKDENTSKGEKEERPTRVAMKCLLSDINPKEDSIWTWCQDAMTKTVNTTNEGGKFDADNSKLAQKFLGAVIVASKSALDSGPQGVDLAAKADVEAWKAILRQAGRDLALGTGKQVFDPDQADWLRSGVGSKTSLALTLDDMRNLLGE